MVTIFTCPKPFVDEKITIIQSNAINSWKKLYPKVQIIIIGNDKSVERFAKTNHLEYTDDLKTDRYGTPFVNSIFKLASKKAKYKTLAYINTDIILFNDFSIAVEKINILKKEFLLLARRTDLAVNKLINFNVKNSVDNFMKFVKSEGKIHDYRGVDIFVFTKGLWRSIPNFVVGRTSYDLWFIHEALSITPNVIDATNVILSVHQNHDYSAVQQSQIGKEYLIQRSKNEQLALGKMSTIKGANYYLSNKYQILKTNKMFDREYIWFSLVNTLNYIFKVRMPKFIHNIDKILEK
jgi:hypothetical protein